MTKFTKYWSALFVLVVALKCQIMRFNRFLSTSYSIRYDFTFFPGSQKVIGSIPILSTDYQCVTIIL